MIAVRITKEPSDYPGHCRVFKHSAVPWRLRVKLHPEHKSVQGALPTTRMARKEVFLRCLEYDVSLVPEAGKEVVCSVAGPISTGSKDPAGFYFHLAQLKLAGLWGELQS